MPHRRAFLKTLAGTAIATAASSRRIAGANDRIRVGLIGNGLIGKRHLIDFQAQADCEIAGVSEVSEERMEDAVTTAGGTATRYPDFRRLLDQKDVDVVVVSTPDHWHALMTIMACAAGKDVYVEKPLTHVLREGEWMLAAAKQHKRIVQVGTQQRAGAHYQRARQLLADGHIGEIRAARVSTARNILPGFREAVGKPLSPAQWDLWLGPAPAVPYEPTRGLYHFRWFWDYSGGQTTNLLSHEVDIVQWITGQLPRRAAAFAQRQSLTGIGETPAVFEGIFEYPGFLLNWSSREVSAGGRGGLEIYGTRGMLAINRRGFEITPDPLLSPEAQIPRFTTAPSDEKPGQRCAPVKESGFDQVRDQFVPHVRNFLDAVKSRQPPIADLESGHRTSLACHLANIAMRVGRVVAWDETANDIAGDREASALLTKTYRAPWDRELRAALRS
jgi:predicted dehydrogenase